MRRTGDRSFTTSPSDLRNSGMGASLARVAPGNLFQVRERQPVAALHALAVALVADGDQLVVDELEEAPQALLLGLARLERLEDVDLLAVEQRHELVVDFRALFQELPAQSGDLLVGGRRVHVGNRG